MDLKRKWQIGNIMKCNHELVLLKDCSTNILEGIFVPKGGFVEILEAKAFLGWINTVKIGKLFNGTWYTLAVDTIELTALSKKENALARILFG